MEIIYILAPLTIILGGVFLVLFIRSGQTGQFDDVETPAHRMLIDEEINKEENHDQ